MGIVRKPTVESYWPNNPLLSTPIFGSVMPRNRFLLLMRFWHCSDNSKEPARKAPNRDRLYKVRPLLTKLQTQFQTVYKPCKFTAIDESLQLWKGQLVFKQYIPLKRARFGIKLFVLCEDSGYAFRFHVYTGKQDPGFLLENHIPPDALHPTLTERLVVFVTNDMMDQGYHLFMDNYYTGVNLFRYLKNKGTVCCGTVSPNRVGIPWAVPFAVRELELGADAGIQYWRAGELLFVK